MTVEAIISHFGLAAILIGSGVEGESAVLAGGFLAHEGLLPPFGVILTATFGSFAADLALFLMGRRLRGHSIAIRLACTEIHARTIGLIERRPWGYALISRFLCGLRTLIPIAIGTSDLPAHRFVILSAFASSCWGLSVAGLGWGLGHVLGLVFGPLHSVEYVALAIPVLIGVALACRWLIRPRC